MTGYSDLLSKRGLLVVCLLLATWWVVGISGSDIDDHSRWMRAIERAVRNSNDDVVIDVTRVPESYSSSVSEMATDKDDDWSAMHLGRINPGSFSVAALAPALDWERTGRDAVATLSASVAKDPPVDLKAIAGQLRDGEQAPTAEAQRAVAVVARKNLLHAIQRRAASLNAGLAETSILVSPPRVPHERRWSISLGLPWGTVSWPYWSAEVASLQPGSAEDVSIELYGVHLREALETTARIAGIRLTMGQLPMNRLVTVRTRNVEPRETLTTLLRVFNLGAREQGNYLHVEIHTDAWPEETHRMRLQAHRAGEMASSEFYHLLPSQLQSGMRIGRGCKVSELPELARQKLRAAMLAKFSAENLFQCSLAQDGDLGKGTIVFPRGRSTASLVHRGIRIPLRELAPLLSSRRRTTFRNGARRSSARLYSEKW